MQIIFVPDSVAPASQSVAIVNTALSWMGETFHYGGHALFLNFNLALKSTIFHYNLTFYGMANSALFLIVPFIPPF